MTHNEYQKLIEGKMRKIFADDLIKTEWDSVAYGGHEASSDCDYCAYNFARKM